MALADRVHVARRFQRAVRIDLDFRAPEALNGFICPPSSAEVLKTMARHVSEGGQGAFTWTGPYGSGKSSLAVALGALLNGNAALRQPAEIALGEENRIGRLGRLAPAQQGLAGPARRRAPGASRPGGRPGDGNLRVHHRPPGQPKRHAGIGRPESSRLPASTCRRRPDGDYRRDGEIPGVGRLRQLRHLLLPAARRDRLAQ